MARERPPEETPTAPAEGPKPAKPPEPPAEAKPTEGPKPAKNVPDTELALMARITRAMSKLEPEARQRVGQYLASRWGNK